jgi:V8-like Glu-specific endopeptidase
LCPPSDRAALAGRQPTQPNRTVRAGATEQYGTGFRIGPDLLLTNWHVVHGKIDQAPASQITAEFGFEDDSTGRPVAGTTIVCDTAIAAMDQDDDWAVVRTVEALQPHWPVVDLDRAVKPNRNDSAFIIQHPLGHRKRVGFVRNQVSYVDDRIVQYLTDTDVGSSGAPVSNAEGRLIALHHAGGRPQEVADKPPIRKNEGILISRISNSWQQPKP